MPCCAKVSAISSTDSICAIVPGLKEICGIPPSRSCFTSSTASSTSGIPAEMVTPSIGRPAATARGSKRRLPICKPHRYGSKNMVLNCALRPSSSSSESRATLASKISGVTWPPPASSAQNPAFAAAATISGSTVVGVIPPSRMGERPVNLVNFVSTRGLSPVTKRGANSSHDVGCSMSLSDRTPLPAAVAAAITATP